MSESTRTKVRKLRIVRQRGEKDCGIAALASIAGCSYEQAETVLPAKTATRGANAQELRAGAMLLTGGIWRIRTFKDKPLIHEADLPDAPVLAAIRAVYPPDGMGHFVVLARGRVLDPAEVKPPLTYQEAGRKGLRVTVTVAPV